MTVREIPESATLVMVDTEVEQLQRETGTGFLTYFVIIGDGDYTHIWGCNSSVPYRDDEIVLLK